MILRRKLRYMLIEASDAVRMDGVEEEELKKGLASFMGQLDCFRANPQVAAQLDDSVFILSVNRGYERSALLALSFIKTLGERSVGFYTIRISGTIRGVKSAFRSLY